MKRRDFLKYLLATPLAAELDVEKLLWIPEKKKIFTYTFHPAQLAFYEGIPYHENNAASGVWLGMSRTSVYPEFRKLIYLMEEDKRKAPTWNIEIKNG
jgi:hypothetical protein